MMRLARDTWRTYGMRRTMAPAFLSRRCVVSPPAMVSFLAAALYSSTAEALDSPMKALEAYQARGIFGAKASLRMLNKRMTSSVEEVNKAYGVFMNRLYSASDYRTALEFLEVLERSNPTLRDPYLYNIAIKVCGRAGETQSAFKLYERMQAKGMDVGEPDTQLALMTCLVTTHDTVKAKEILEGINANASDPAIIPYLDRFRRLGMLTCLKGGDLASSFASEILEQVEQVKGVEETHDSHHHLSNLYGHALLVFGRFKDADKVTDVWNRAKGANAVSLFTYHAAIEALGLECGKFDEAIRIFEELLERTAAGGEDGQSLKATEETFTLMTTVALSNGRDREASKVIKRSLKASLKPSNSLLRYVAMVGTGQHEEA